jgi:hypothetical protein
MHSSDEFSDLGFRVATRVVPPVPAVSGSAGVVLLLAIAGVGAIALRLRAGPGRA